jgi:hypothetical protein
LTLCIIALLGAPVARAAGLGDLSAEVDRAVAGRLSEDQEQALFGELAQVSVQLADRYDQWVRTASSEHRSAATRLADGLRPLLERLRAYHQGRIDKAQKEIIAADGNPEVLYEQRWWQLDRGFALAAAGQLAWLHYRSAMLHPDKEAQRKAWLQSAVREKRPRPTSTWCSRREKAVRCTGPRGSPSASCALARVAPRPSAKPKSFSLTRRAPACPPTPSTRFG